MSGEEPKIAKMTFTRVGGDHKAISAQFNPTSLVYTITNSAKQGSNKQRQQRIDNSSAKLTFDLTFDTTHNGKNVREQTQAVAILMEPEGDQKIAPEVDVTWGGFDFRGVIDSYKETIDFFSEGGVPLRATVSLGLCNTTDKNQAPAAVFEFIKPGKNALVAEVNKDDFVVDIAVENRTATTLATQSGNPNQAKNIGKQTGSESLRDLGAATDILSLSPGLPILGEPIAFATGGASAGFSGGASAGISNTVTFRASGSASARVTATGGAFAMLRSPPTPSSASFNPALLVRNEQTSSVSTRNAVFAVGGQVRSQASSGLSADVGATSSFANHLEFDEE